MSETPHRRDDDITILDRVTQALQANGEQAELEHTGGGIFCIRVPISGDEWMYWGTADDVWGCDVYKGEVYLDSASLDRVPVSSDNIPQAADAIVAFTKSLRK